jgi:hypothetical protein
MARLDDLRRIAPPPALPTGRAPDTDRVRHELGVDLPADYVALVEEWGGGVFDDFVTVYEPGHPNPNLELVEEARRWSWAQRRLREQGGKPGKDLLPYSPEIEPGGLLAWGASANGDPCFWHLRSLDPNSWIVAVQEARGPDFHVHGGELADFLVGLLERRVRVSVFPEDFPSQDPGFARL